MKMVELGKVAHVLNGYAFKSNEYVNTGIRVIRITNVQKGEIKDSDPKFISLAQKHEFTRYMLADGDILISLTGNVGRVGVMEKAMLPAALNQRVGALKISSTDVFPSYVFYLLNSEKFEQDAIRNSKGIAQLNLSSKWVEGYKIPLPPLEEQKRIAEILDHADAMRKERAKSIDLLDDLIQATFIDMFGDPVTNPKGWDVGIIGDLLESANYGTSKKAHLTDGEYPVLRMNNITYKGAWDFQSLKYMNLEPKELPKHLVHKGQILFNRTNSKELVGKTAVYREDAPMAFAGYLVRGIANELADPEYIGAYMNLPQTKLRLRNMCKNIVGMANINAKEFQKIPIQKPPAKLQNQFAAIVEEIEARRELYKEQLDELNNLFSALQQKAFKGEL